MTHYILLKLKPTFKTKDVNIRIADTYTKLGSMVDGVGSVDIYPNSINRPDNADILIRMEVRDEPALEAYLTHPIHLKFAEYMDQRIEHRTTFDFKETM